MEVLKTSKPLTPQEQYRLTMSPGVQKMKDAVSQQIEIDVWAIYTDLNSKGELQTILAIATPEGDIIATNSKTFREDFLRMWDFFNANGETVKAVKVISGKSKTDREFITCTFAA